MTEPTPRSLVVDTSAAVAVIFGEAGSEELAAHLEDALIRLMSATTNERFIDIDTESIEEIADAVLELARRHNRS